MIPLIATGQLLIAVGMLLKGWWVQWACIGAIIFLLSIAPFMVGSAFPFSITVSVAAWMILKKDDRNYIWKRKKIITAINELQVVNTVSPERSVKTQTH
jgi:hypothetical protein